MRTLTIRNKESDELEMELSVYSDLSNGERRFIEFKFKDEIVPDDCYIDYKLWNKERDGKMLRHCGHPTANSCRECEYSGNCDAEIE